MVALGIKIDYFTNDPKESGASLGEVSPKLQPYGCYGFAFI